MAQYTCKYTIMTVSMHIDNGEVMAIYRQLKIELA